MKFLVTVGSYERSLYGIDIFITKEGKITLKTAFALPAHTSCIKTIQSNQKYLISGSTDETIRIFDLRKRKDVGSLAEHGGAVTSLAMAGDGHFLSGGEDGKVAVWRVKDWECLHILMHKKPVTSLAVHPSGKVALSVGQRRSLKLWNLMTGKQAHSTKLPYEPVGIKFSPSNGDQYAILYGSANSPQSHLHLHETAGGNRIISKATVKSRLISFVFWRPNIIMAVGDGPLIYLFIQPTSTDFTAESATEFKVITFDTEMLPRLKDICLLLDTPLGDLVIVAASNGLVTGYSVNEDDYQFTKVFSHDCSSLRITCLTATHQQ